MGLFSIDVNGGDGVTVVLFFSVFHVADVWVVKLMEAVVVIVLLL